MTGTDRLDDALAAHDAYERTDDGWDLTTTPLEVSLTGEERPDAGTDPAPVLLEVEVRLPGLDASVPDGSVADVVEDDWAERLERLLGDAFDVVTREPPSPPSVTRTDEALFVHCSFWDTDVGAAIADAKTVVEYVEGTYAQSLIPGYEYAGPAAALLDRARERGERSADTIGP